MKNVFKYSENSRLIETINIYHVAIVFENMFEVLQRNNICGIFGEENKIESLQLLQTKSFLIALILVFSLENQGCHFFVKLHT